MLLNLGMNWPAMVGVKIKEKERTITKIFKKTIIW